MTVERRSGIAHVHDEPMRVDLSDTQWWDVTGGRLVSPDGVAFLRRGTRAQRRVCDKAMAQGASLVLYCFGGGQLDWLEGADAEEEWRSVRSAVTSEMPRPHGDMIWTAGLWHSETEQTAVVLTGHC